MVETIQFLFLAKLNILIKNGCHASFACIWKEYLVMHMKQKNPYDLLLLLVMYIKDAEFLQTDSNSFLLTSTKF